MADMMEYYQQIGDLKKAVRERELHRLELEKQALLCAQNRERRHEDFKEKIREIQRELSQKEREAAHNFQRLLARVDSIRREHQILAAHTEQLRQRKLQYEMSLRNANPVLHTAVHQDLTGILSNSDDAAWKGHFQPTSTPSSKSQLQQSTLPPQPLMSPTASYNPASKGNMPTQLMDKHISRVVNQNQHEPFMVPMAPLSMPNINLTEESQPHGGVFSQQGNMIKIPPTYNQPSRVDYTIPHDISREPPHNGMVLHSHSNMAKPSNVYSQPSHMNHMIPHVSTEPPTISHDSRELLTHDTILSQTQGNMAITPIIHNQPSHEDYIIPHASREPLTHSGMISQTQSNSDIAPTTYIHPSHTDHTTPDDASRTGVYHQSHPTIQPATRDPLEYNRSTNLNASQSHLSGAPITSNPTPSIPDKLQSVSYPSGTDMNYLHNPQQSTLQPHHFSATGSLQTNGYVPKMHNNLPTASPNGVSNYTPAKSISERGFESEYISSHPKTFSHDSLNHKTSPSLNTILHPELDTQYNKGALPPSAEIYESQSNMMVKREIPEKDTTISQPSISRQDAVEVFSSLREEELAKKPPTMPNMNDKPRVTLSPKKHYDERTQNDSPVRDETKNNRNGIFPAPNPYAALSRDSTLQDNEYNKGKTATPERSTKDNIPSGSTGTDFLEPKDDLVSQTELSRSSTSEATSNMHHENYHKPSITQTTDDTNSLPELRPDTVLSKDVYNSEVDDRKGPRAQYQSETKQTEIVHLDRQLSSSQEAPSPELTKNNSPDRQSSSSKVSLSTSSTKHSPIRATSALPSKASENELKHLYIHSSSSNKSPPSPPSKNNARPTSALPSKVPAQNVEDSDTDFFDQNINVTDSAAYKSLVGDTRKGSDGTESENDEAEGQLSRIISKPQTSVSRPSFKSFASSIPSLRPAPPDTDTDSVDSVEAAIQAAMKKKDPEATAEPSRETPHSESSLKQDTKSEIATEQVKDLAVKPGTDTVPSKKKQNTAAALAINLDSECESYEVSAGGEASDEDDFDFYDKF